MTGLFFHPGLQPSETAVSRTTDDQSPITSKDRQGGVECGGGEGGGRRRRGGEEGGGNRFSKE